MEIRNGEDTFGPNKRKLYPSKAKECAHKTLQINMLPSASYCRGYLPANLCISYQDGPICVDADFSRRPSSRLRDPQKTNPCKMGPLQVARLKADALEQQQVRRLPKATRHRTNQLSSFTPCKEGGTSWPLLLTTPIDEAVSPPLVVTRFSSLFLRVCLALPFKEFGSACRVFLAVPLSQDWEIPYLSP